MATEEENRRLAYSIVRAQLTDLLSADGDKVLRTVWRTRTTDVTVPISAVEDQLFSVAFHVEELVTVLRSELNRQQREDVGL
jgi:exosome complex RNA-binding protein Csl4